MGWGDTLNNGLLTLNNGNALFNDFSTYTSLLKFNLSTARLPNYFLGNYNLGQSNVWQDYTNWLAILNLNLINTDSGGLSIGSGGGSSGNSGSSGGGGSTVLSESFTDRFNNSKFGLTLQMGGLGLSSFYDKIPTADKVYNSNDLFTANLRGQASKTLLSSGNPYGMLVGAGIMALDKTGGFSDASEGLGKSTDFWNGFASLTFGGAGYFLDKTRNYKMSNELATSSSYTGSANNSLTAMKNSGAKLFFGRNKANTFIDNAANDDLAIGRILGYNRDRILLSLHDMYNLRHQIDVNGNYELKFHKSGKLGMKFPTKEEMFKVRSILSKKSGGIIKEPEFYSVLAEDIEEEILEFKLGGTIIPEGALHARKNNMEGAGKDFTHKGIPVVDNQGEQLAEIECNEIIFSLEVTKKLEQLMEDGSDKAAIEAGKLLVKEIFENTEDRTGLIASITGEEITPDEEDLSKLEEGGTIEIAKEGTKVADNEEDTISLEDFINEKIKSRTEAAILKATTRKTPYMFRNKSWKNCIATISDNYGVPIIMRNADLATDPTKYGFEEIFFGDDTDTLPDGVILLDYNKENDPTTPGHSIMLVGRTETGAPIYSYSSGDNTPESMHRSTTNYKFRRWDNKIKPRAYRYIGTPAERLSWTDEYNALYPKKQ